MARLHISSLVILIMAFACPPLLSQTVGGNPATPSTPAGLGSTYSLDQFGPVATAEQAEVAYQKAMKDVIAPGGGVIVIPPQTAVEWMPRNNMQEELRSPLPPMPANSWKVGIGVTLVDVRGVKPKVIVPQVSGLEINRVLNLPQGQSLSYQEESDSLVLDTTILRGPTSYNQPLQENVKAGKGQRFYVATIRGLFPGMFINHYFSGPIQRLYVQSLGYDNEKKMWYFLADTQHDIGRGSLLSNKNQVNILDVKTSSNTESKTYDVRVWHRSYSQGDTFLYDGRLYYMGDVHATGNDDNGVVYSAMALSDKGVFRSRVGSWNPTTGELVYAGHYGGSGDHHGPTPAMSLGSGRPIINLNPAKWITGGTVCIVAPAAWAEDSQTMKNPLFQGKSYPTKMITNKLDNDELSIGGLIRFSADAPVTEDVVGRYFAVDEPDESVTPYVEPAKGPDVFEVPDGGKLRRWYLIDSVTKNVDGTRDIRIIRHWWGAAPAGAPTLYKPENYSWDGHVKPLKYIIAPGANVYDASDAVVGTKFSIKLVPSPVTGTALDFTPADPFEQAIGPDPFKPILFRGWVSDAVPGIFPAPIFDIANNGTVMRDSVLWVRGNSTNDIVMDQVTHYDRNPLWNKLIKFDSTCNTGIWFGADVGDAAIMFTQPNDREQPIKWLYANRKKEASLTVSTDDGTLRYTGGNVVVPSLLVNSGGLSATTTPARNLRGLNTAVKAGATSVSVTFPTMEADDQYGVFIEQSWLSNRAIVNKDAQGFTVQFEKPAPEGAKLDWMLVR